METSALQRIKQKAGKFFEPQFLQTGTVLEVRAWEPSTLIEVDLHLPLVDMTGWSDIPYIKFKVADFTYRDYTPSGWDAGTCTCTIYVDAGHNGPGSNWARQLQKGDTVKYLKARPTSHAPEATSAIVGLGDESSMGHLLALQQMVLPSARFTGAILMNNENHRELFSEYFRSPIQPVANDDRYAYHGLIQWLIDQQYSLENTVFYIAGNNSMVIQIRKLLRLQGYSSAQIKAQGFWK